MLMSWSPHTVRPGDIVLVWGGAGGLGCQAIQIAKAAGGIPVAVISSDDKIDFCKQIGARGTINRKQFSHWGMAQVVVNLRTIDLRKAQQAPVTGDDVKTLQGLLNLFLTAGDVGEDGTPILPLTVDGTAGAKTKEATLAFQTAAHLATDAIVGPLTWRKLVEQDW